MSNKNYYSITAASGTSKGLIRMTGFISMWENNYEDFAADFRNLEQSCDEIDIEIVNLYGGSVFEGIPTYKLIKDSKVKTNTKVLGVAASMGSIIAIAGNNRREIAPLSRMMLHRAKGPMFGDFEDFKDQAKLLEDLHIDLAGLYVTNSNKDLKYVYNNWMVRGADKWLNVQECLDFGLMTGTTDSVSAIKSDAPTNILEKGVDAVVQYYNVQMAGAFDDVNNNDQNTDEMEKVTMFLSLNKEASQDAILSAIQAKINEGVADKQRELNAVQAKLDGYEATAKTEKATKLVDDAIAAKKIIPGQKESYMKLALADYDSTKAIFEGLKGATSIVSELEKQRSEIEAVDAKKDFDWYQRNDPTALAKIREAEPERYNAMLKQYTTQK